MCGIAGILKYKLPGTDNIAITRMTEAIAHRGPDATGIFVEGKIALGHNRLSIIDLSSCSNQPMADNTGRYELVYNGEIYNYRQIKQQLPNYTFTTEGDTELILAAFSTWGYDCVKHFAGMFAFAIWDKEKNELFLTRDRLGVKPLYFSNTSEGFVFASEIRAVLASGMVPKKLNLDAVAEFLQYQSVGFPNTIIQNIQTLEAGTYMVIGSNGISVKKYWNILSERPAFDYTDKKNTKSALKKLLYTAVERRMVSDVPVAAFLSGGIDSTAVVGLMTATSKEPVNTFTVGFREKEFDESAQAEMVSKKFNTNHQQILLQPENFLEQLLPALNAMDTPTGDGINSYVVCRAIRKNNIKVALSGVGGDELFAGYPIFSQYLKLMKLRSSWKLLGLLRSVAAAGIASKNSKSDRYKQLLSAKKPGIGSFYPAFRQIVSRRMITDCTTLNVFAGYPGNGVLEKCEEDIEQLPLLSQVSVAEYLGYTQFTLLKDMDQMSMASSLEVREPFFDHELIEFVLQIPDAQKNTNFPKQLLVETLEGLIPDEIVHRKKQGFVFPWKEWMKKELRPFCETHLKSIATRDFIKEKPLMDTWKRFLDNDPSVRWMEIWLFVVLEYWLQKNNVS